MALGDKNRSGDKASADLLRRSLAASAGAAGLRAEECPDPEILAAYSERALDADETSHYELHFSQCARCREQLAALGRATVPAVGARAPRLSWIWDWRLLALAPVAAALIIVVVFFARVSTPKSASSQAPLVAMQPPGDAPVTAAIPQSSPADRASEVPATPPAKPTPPPAPSRMRTDSGAMPMTAPNSTTALKSGYGDIIAVPAPEEKELVQSASNAPTVEGNVRELDKSTKKAPAESTAPESSTTNSYSVVARSKDGTVILSGTAVPARSNPPTPPDIADNSVSGPLSHGDAGAPAAAAPKKQQTVALSATSGFSVNETVSVGSLDDRDARTIVRSPDPRILWRISSGRYVERSNDAGATWRAQWSSVNAHVVAGSAPSIETCWLVGRGGIVLLTTDGKKWRTIDPPASADFAQVEASNAVSATVTSTDGRKFETSDGGKHWTPAP